MFATRIDRLESSPIRDILGALEDPDMVSFAGGLPHPDTFPGFEPEAMSFADCLQYGSSEGERELRERVAEHMRESGVPASAERVLILSGSQQGIDLAAKLMIDDGSRLAIQSPSYLAALQVFSMFGADYVPLRLQDGVASFETSEPALLYLNPTFQNPTGEVLDFEERCGVAALCDREGTVLFEDDPYRELVYDSCDRTPVCSLVQDAEWIYQSSFSKTVAPGLRLGFLCCSEGLYPYLLRLKQAADLHTNRVGQKLALDVLTRGDSTQRLTWIRENYRSKRDEFEALLLAHFRDLASWRTPKGGLFYWLALKGNRRVDTVDLLQRSLADHVAFMPGEPFHVEPPERSYIRLNFSNADPEKAEAGLERLAALVADSLTR